MEIAFISANELLGTKVNVGEAVSIPLAPPDCRKIVGEKF